MTALNCRLPVICPARIFDIVHSDVSEISAINIKLFHGTSVSQTTVLGQVDFSVQDVTASRGHVIGI
jgi:hypothetical protein